MINFIIKIHNERFYNVFISYVKTRFNFFYSCHQRFFFIYELYSPAVMHLRPLRCQWLKIWFDFRRVLQLVLSWRFTSFHYLSNSRIASTDSHWKVALVFQGRRPAACAAPFLKTWGNIYSYNYISFESQHRSSRIVTTLIVDLSKLQEWARSEFIQRISVLIGRIACRLQPTPEKLLFVSA